MTPPRVSITAEYVGGHPLFTHWMPGALVVDGTGLAFEYREPTVGAEVLSGRERVSAERFLVPVGDILGAHVEEPNAVDHITPSGQLRPAATTALVVEATIDDAPCRITFALYSVGAARRALANIDGLRSELGLAPLGASDDQPEVDPTERVVAAIERQTALLGEILAELRRTGRRRGIARCVL